MHCVFAKSGSEPTRQTKQPNLLRDNKTLAILQHKKIDKQRVTTQMHKTRRLDKQDSVNEIARPTKQQLDKQNNNSISKTKHQFNKQNTFRTIWVMDRIRSRGKWRPSTLPMHGHVRNFLPKGRTGPNTQIAAWPATFGSWPTSFLHLRGVGLSGYQKSGRAAT